MTQTDTVQSVVKPARNAALAKLVGELPDDAILTPKEASALTGYAAVTLRKWYRTGRGPRCLRIEGRPRYRAADVRAWAAGQAA
ncbi:MAG: helix-turn-helix domain-containing protein [Rhodospirillaceae bacterium]